MLRRPRHACADGMPRPTKRGLIEAFQLFDGSGADNGSIVQKPFTHSEPASGANLVHTDIFRTAPTE
jgi:hypothetical protein